MKGKFIVLEGTDGSGKGTQFELLKNRLISEGFNIATFDFPQYGQPSAYFCEQYLTGAYGTLDEINPQKGSLFYALDRFEASFQIRDALKSGKTVISNRYVGSNMGHQGAKFDNDELRANYFKWNEDIEFNILGIPKPDINLLLHVPAEIAQKLVDGKKSRKYLNGKKRDIHEDDLDHLKMAEKSYLQMCQLFPEYFTKISCMYEGQLQSIEDIAGMVWLEVVRLIGDSQPDKNKQKAKLKS